MKKNIIRLSIAFAALFILTHIIELVLYTDSPKFHLKIIEELKEKTELLERIGGYNSYKFSYDNSSTDRDSLWFELYLYGNDSTIHYKGYAKKISKDEWKESTYSSKIEP